MAEFYRIKRVVQSRGGSETAISTSEPPAFQANGVRCTSKFPRVAMQLNTCRPLEGIRRIWSLLEPGRATGEWPSYYPDKIFSESARG